MKKRKKERKQASKQAQRQQKREGENIAGELRLRCLQDDAPRGIRHVEALQGVQAEVGFQGHKCEIHTN